MRGAFYFPFDIEWIFSSIKLVCMGKCLQLSILSVGIGLWFIPNQFACIKAFEFSRKEGN